MGRNIPAAVHAFGPPEKRVGYDVHSGRSPDENRGKRSSGGPKLQTFEEGTRGHCAGAQAPKSTKPEAIPQSAGAGVWGATSRRQRNFS